MSDTRNAVESQVRELASNARTMKRAELSDALESLRAAVDAWEAAGEFRYSEAGYLRSWLNRAALALR